MTAPRRPNIVFFLTDDHACNAISCYGSQVAKTRGIDAIARDGARFDTALVENALCTPSRAAILTGTYSHTSGVTTLATHLTNDHDTFITALKNAGYRTAIFGKWHLGHGPDYDPTGFDHWEVLNDQGTYDDPEFFTPEGLVQREGYVTDIITERSLDWMRQQGDQPYCVLIWHKAPHRPWIPHPELRDRPDEDVPLPDTFDDDYTGRGTPARHAMMRVADDLTDIDLKRQPPAELGYRDLAEWKYRRYLTDYVRTAATMDEGIARTRDALIDRGHWDDTLTLYGSDQGFYLGEHGWFDKRFMYEESLRMPLVMSYPARIAPGSATGALVSNVDIAQTILDAAGVDAPEGMQGESLLPLVPETGGARQHPKQSVRDAHYYRYYEHDDHMHHVWAHYGIRTERYKLIFYYADGMDLPNTSDMTYPPEWELFDLRRDPHEMTSVHLDPEYAQVRHDLTVRLWDLQQELGDVPHPNQPVPPGRSAPEAWDRADDAARGTTAAVRRAGGALKKGQSALKKGQGVPNVVVIYADDLGYGDIGCFGSGDIRTPHLDRLARRGVRLTNWYANSPVCSPSRAALLTGRHPARAGVQEILGGARGTPGLPEQPTLADRLKKRGFATGIFGKWHLGTGDTYAPTERGFDTHLGFRAGCVDYYSHIFYWGAGNPVHDLWDGQNEAWHNGRYLTELIAEAASDFITEHRSEPFFCYVPFNAPHYPMHAPQKYVDRFPDLPADRRILAAMVSAMDDGIGMILDTLERAGLAEDTLVLFSSDNGPSTESRNWLGGEEIDYEGGSTGGLRGHKGSLFDGGIRVPTLISWPAQLPQGIDMDEPGQMMDVVPTVLSAVDGTAGIGGVPTDSADAADDALIDGIDMLPELRNAGATGAPAERAGQGASVPAPERTLFWEYGPQLAARRGDHKLVISPREHLGGPFVTERMLVNLREDPAETRDLAPEHPELADRLETELREWARSIDWDPTPWL